MAEIHKTNATVEDIVTHEVWSCVLDYLVPTDVDENFRATDYRDVGVLSRVSKTFREAMRGALRLNVLNVTRCRITVHQLRSFFDYVCPGALKVFSGAPGTKQTGSYSVDEEVRYWRFLAEIAEQLTSLREFRPSVCSESDFFARRPNKEAVSAIVETVESLSRAAPNLECLDVGGIPAEDEECARKLMTALKCLVNLRELRMNGKAANLLVAEELGRFAGSIARGLEVLAVQGYKDGPELLSSITPLLSARLQRFLDFLENQKRMKLVDVFPAQALEKVLHCLADVHEAIWMSRYVNAAGGGEEAFVRAKGLLLASRYFLPPPDFDVSTLGAYHGAMQPLPRRPGPETDDEAPDDVPRPPAAPREERESQSIFFEPCRFLLPKFEAIMHRVRPPMTERLLDEKKAGDRAFQVQRWGDSEEPSASVCAMLLEVEKTRIKARRYPKRDKRGAFPYEYELRWSLVDALEATTASYSNTVDGGGVNTELYYPRLLRIYLKSTWRGPYKPSEDQAKMLISTVDEYREKILTTIRNSGWFIELLHIYGKNTVELFLEASFPFLIIDSAPYV